MKVLGVPNQDLAEKRRRAEEARDDLKGPRIVVEVRDERGPWCSRRDIPTKPNQGCIGVRRFDEAVKQSLGKIPDSQAGWEIVRKLLQDPISRFRVSKPT